jgi:hypothetical protein
MSSSELVADPAEGGTLNPALRSFHWPFVWFIINLIALAGLVRWGWQHALSAGLWKIVAISTIGLGYMFFIDINEKIWWTTTQIFSRGWDALSLKPMHHEVRIDELTKVASALHPANFMPGKPFDRILFVTPSDTVTVQTSFYRREEVEELLRLVRAERPEVPFDPDVVEFTEGGFTDWWKYR